MQSLRFMVAGLVGGIVVLVGTWGVGALAQSPANSPTTYYACLKDGALTNVGTSSPTCGRKASLISWESSIPTGTITGANEVAGSYYFSNGVNSGYSESCPSGEVVISGFAYDSSQDIDNGAVEPVEAQTAFTSTFSNEMQVYPGQFTNASGVSSSYGMVCASVSP